MNDRTESSGRIEIGKVLPMTRIAPLPEDVTEVEFAYLIAKVKYRDGDVSWVYRTDREPNKYELLGALRIHQKLLESELLEDWDVEDV